MSIAALYSFSACAKACFFGATTLATLSYLTIAMTHLHNPSAAVEAVFTLSGSKFSFVKIRFCNLSITAVGMLS